jgi:hypothetical protein
MPETRSEPTLDLQVIDENLNFPGSVREVTADIEDADFNTSQFSAYSVRFDDHGTTNLRKALAR